MPVARSAARTRATRSCWRLRSNGDSLRWRTLASALAALYLANPLAAWVTGTTIHVDGGALAAAGWTRDPKGNRLIVPVVSGNGFNF